MTISDDEDESLAHFLESEILSEVSDQEEGKNFAEIGKGKEEGSDRSKAICGVAVATNNNKNNKYGSASCNRIDDSIINNNKSMRIEGGVFSKMPPELFPHILKFLSSEDLVSCSLVCRSLNYAASDESLWRRLYCMRWGLLPPSKKSTQYAWKKLYIQRDEEDVVKLVRNCPPEFKEYYLQMQASKRSQAPLPSQVIGDQIILDKTVSDQVSIWKGKKGLGDKVVRDHTCTGDSCSFFKIGDVFVCEKTGNVHVCDDTCREVVMDPTNQLFVCTISGHCFDRLVGPSELDPDPDEPMRWDTIVTMRRSWKLL